MFHFDIEVFAEPALAGVDRHTLRPAPERRREVQLHTFPLQHTIRREILTFEVGVDRHLGTSASSDGRNEVDSYSAASPAHQIGCIFGQNQLHALLTLLPHDVKWSRVERIAELVEGIREA